MSVQDEVDRTVYTLAKKFLLDRIGSEISLQKICDPLTGCAVSCEQFLSGYLADQWSSREESLSGYNGTFRILVESAQNRRDMPASISSMLASAKSNPGVPATLWDGTLRDLGRLNTVLLGFDPADVFHRYSYDSNAEFLKASDQLLTDILQQLQPTKLPRMEPKSHWPNFCRSIISGARFLTTFGTYDAFHDAVLKSSISVYKRMDLAEAYSERLYGFGFALTCSFLKDAGFSQFSKPDSHVKDFCKLLGFCGSGEPLILFKVIDRIAAANQVDPFAVDKLVWLIGSGHFHSHFVQIPPGMNSFVEYASQNGFRASDNN